MDNKKKLKILQWFANGIINKTSEFVALADWNDTDIIAISETRLTAKQRLYIARPTGTDGVIILAILKRLSSRRLPLSDHDTTEAVSTEIRLGDGTHVIIASIYSPPRNTPLDIAFLESILKLNDNVILTGDSNAKH